MKEFLKNVAALVKVKTIVTITVLVVFVVLALRGDITPENVMQITTTVIVFYFGTQQNKVNSEQISSDHSSYCPLLLGDTDKNVNNGETEPEPDINERAE